MTTPTQPASGDQQAANAISMQEFLDEMTLDPLLGHEAFLFLKSKWAKISDKTRIAYTPNPTVWTSRKIELQRFDFRYIHPRTHEDTKSMVSFFCGYDDKTDILWSYKHNDDTNR